MARAAPPRCARAEALRPAPPGHTRGLRSSGDGGNHHQTTTKPQPRAARRLFTAPYGCRGRGEGDVCRLRYRCAHYVRWSHGHPGPPPPAPQPRGRGGTHRGGSSPLRLPSRTDFWGTACPGRRDPENPLYLQGMVLVPGNKK